MPTILTNVSPDRPWFERLTLLGVVLLGGLQAAETTGAVPTGTAPAIVELLNRFGELLVVTGIYKQVAK